MKRVWQHLLFWVFYLLLCMNMEYLWVGKLLPHLPSGELLHGVLFSSGLSSLPEIAFAYYLMYAGLPGLVKKSIPVWMSLLKIAVVLFCCIMMVRLIGYYIVSSVAFRGELPDPGVWDLSLLWRTVIYFGFSSGLALTLKIFRSQAKTANRERELIEEKLKVELKLLRNQLNPHFLFNTLNNIYALTKIKSDLAPEIVLRLSGLLDFMLYKANTDLIVLKKELAFLKDYAALENIRYGSKLQLRFREDIQNPEAPVVPLLLLPFVENAFKHGAGETTGAASINVELTERNNLLRFRIENTMEADSAGKQEGEGLGIKNSRRILELSYRDYNLCVEKKDCYFIVDLSIHLDSYAKNQLSYS
ncbi:MAG TPA: histidine kinase [Chitinophagaceae bacterium]|nr:histidine kinase [Chitinophagaceae bacterium]